MTVPTMRTMRDAAKLTGLSYDCIRKMCLSNKIVYVKAGVKFLVNMEKLVEYLQTGEVHAAPNTADQEQEA